MHSLWHGFFAHLQPGEQPWAGLAPGAVNTHLRRTLTRLEVQFGQYFHLLALVLHVVVQVKDPQAYGSHDLRRGHAKDLQKSKHPLATICAMGQWKHGMS